MKILVVVDMQNDFIDGSLGTPEARQIVDRVAAKIAAYDQACVFATRDTHAPDYLTSCEGRLEEFLAMQLSIRLENLFEMLLQTLIQLQLNQLMQLVRKRKL